MSGIYIPGMEMPTSCHDCRFCGWSNFWQAYNCHMTKNHALLLFNGEKTNSDSRTRNGRADNCPLVPVPEHGRLIDADKMRESIRRQTGLLKLMGGELSDLAETIEKGFLQEIANAPTIIPADKGGDV